MENNFENSNLENNKEDLKIADQQAIVNFNVEGPSNNHHADGLINDELYLADSAEIRSIRTYSIVSIVLFCTLILALVSLILDIICAVKILGRKWQNPKYETNKILWGILTLLILGPIASLIFSLL